MNCRRQTYSCLALVDQRRHPGGGLGTHAGKDMLIDVRRDHSFACPSRRLTTAVGTQPSARSSRGSGVVRSRMRGSPDLADMPRELLGEPVRIDRRAVSEAEHEPRLDVPAAKCEPLRDLRLAVVAQRRHRGWVERDRPPTPERAL
jgi:hypothetical protein